MDDILRGTRMTAHGRASYTIAQFHQQDMHHFLRNALKRFIYRHLNPYVLRTGFQYLRSLCTVVSCYRWSGAYILQALDSYTFRAHSHIAFSNRTLIAFVPGFRCLYSWALTLRRVLCIYSVSCLQQLPFLKSPHRVSY